MEQCLLSDIPAAQFEAVLHHLTSHDYGNLRQVSQAVFTRTTQHAPYLILRLSHSSSMQYPQQWCRATHRLQHVSSIRIIITGKVTSDIFKTAMRLLSQRTRLTELHLLAADVESSSSSNNITIIPRLDTLLPLESLIQRLKTLVICGIAVRSLAQDLQHITAAAAAAVVAGWQLQHLTIEADWSYDERVPWPDLPSTLRHLVMAFPMLQQLHVKLPPLQYAPLSLSYTAGRGTTSSWEKSLTDVAATAAFINAAICLRHLQQLTVYGLYDIWKPILTLEGQSALATAAAAASAGARDDRKKAAAVLDGILSDGQLPSVSAAAAAFGTLDDLGRWLLQHHPALTALHIGIQNSAWEMSWQRLRSLLDTIAEVSAINLLEISGSSGATSEEVLKRIALDLSVVILNGLQINTPDEDPQSSSSSGGGSGDGSSGSGGTGSSNSGTSYATRYITKCLRSPLYCFSQSLSSWSSRPAADLMCYIISYELELTIDDDGDRLLDLLSDLTSLKHLEIVLSCVSHHGRDSSADTTTTSQNCSPMAVMKAVSAVPDLKSFTMHMQGPPQQLPSDLLLPLTAAAGGPGSNLKKLHLSGNFAIEAATLCETAHFPELFHVLKQLQGLVDLTVSHRGGGHMCRFSADNLPAGLTLFRGKNLVIDSAAAANTSAAAAHASGSNSQCNAVRGMCPSLQRLHIVCCQLSSPSIFASKQLQQLVVDDSNWSGGWAAAAAAWPNVRQLLWEFDDSSELATSAHVFQDICAGFNQLGSLSLNVPAQWLSSDLVKHVVQYLSNIRYIRFQGYINVSTEEVAQFHDTMNQDWLQPKFPWANVSIHLLLVQPLTNIDQQ